MICPRDARVRIRNAGRLVDYDAAQIPRHSHPRRVSCGPAAPAGAGASGNCKNIPGDVAVSIEALGKNLLLDTATAMSEPRESVGDRLKSDRGRICRRSHKRHCHSGYRKFLKHNDLHFLLMVINFRFQSTPISRFLDYKGIKIQVKCMKKSFFQATIYPRGPRLSLFLMRRARRIAGRCPQSRP